MTLDTAKTPIRNQKRKTGIRWPVTMFTPDGQIEGETENICPAGMVIFSEKSPPGEERFSIVIKAPNRQPLQTTAKVVMTTPGGCSDANARLRTLVHFDQISRADRNLLCNMIAKHYHRKITRAAEAKRTKAKVAVVRDNRQDRPLQVVEPRLPVIYNREGKIIEAWGNRFSTRGCHIYSKIPLPAGTIFSLKIIHPETEESVQVDSAVTVCKHLARGEKWGMAIRFMNLATADKQQIRLMLEALPTAHAVAKEQKYQEAPIGQTIQRYFNLKKLITFIK